MSSEGVVRLCWLGLGLCISTHSDIHTCIHMSRYVPISTYSHSYSFRYSLIHFVIRISFVSSLSRMKYLATVNSIRISLALPSSLCAPPPPSHSPLCLSLVWVSVCCCCCCCGCCSSAASTHCAAQKKRLCFCLWL